MLQYVVMKKSVTEYQFTEAVYRNYLGEPLTSIAKDFGVGQSTLSQLKSRRSDDWERIRQQIVATQIVQMVFQNPNDFPFNIRENTTTGT